MTTGKRLSKQFKLQAIELMRRSDMPAVDIEGELGLRRDQIYILQRDLKR